ncbi:MAG: flagellin [Phenylobacterium sp.]|uniref:flagellin n=1 Tax=Phenylobacterium sp. TaxID=1871053 RepID=UPI0012280BF0|nr:flagellin [Phenylobacterium sp.]TAJ74741.1 MAG: flagellin [Phenylobacterium sp.]
MPYNSINTNVGAMVAIQSFNAINAEMAVVQMRITTGKKINSPKDNPAIWAIAQNQRSEIRGLDAVTSSLQRGMSVVDIAIGAAETISDLLNEMKTLAVSAADYPASDPARTAINENYLALKKQIDTAVSSASFSGLNLLAGGGSTDRVRALANTSATSTIDVDHLDLSTTGSLLSGLPADLMGGFTPTSVSDIATATSNVNNAISRLGTGSKRLESHLKFVGKQQDALEAAVGNLVDADLAKESARWQALQVRQQLAIYAMQIANKQPSYLLQLFQ